MVRTRWIVLGCLLLAIGACTGEISEGRPSGPGGPTGPGTPEGFEPFVASMQRLTTAQYANSINDIVGSGLVMPVDLEPDTSISGFVSIGAARTTISPVGVEKYETAAYEIAQQAVAADRRDAFVPCTPVGTTDSACLERFVREVGGRFFRRPLTEDEVARYVAVGDNAAATLGDFYAGIEFALAGFLQSPNFLFRVELGEAGAAAADNRRYTDYEMASRLSYVLWNTTPDDELLAAADRGELTTDDGLRAQAERLLTSDRSRDAVRNFFGELLVLDRLAEIEKSATAYPGFTDSLRVAAREETLALVEHHVFERDGDYRDLFTTEMTFVNAELAAHYGLSRGVDVPDAGLWEATLPAEGGRRGLLGHASFLSIYAHDEKTSAAVRGRFVRQVLLCGNIPDPPPDVSTTFPPSDARTLRERVEQHLMNAGCAGCHALMDPIGLGLENFDAVGQFRATENGATIDPSGVLDGAEFADAADLGRVVAEHPNVGPCLTRNLYRYASGNTETRAQEAEIDRLAAGFADDGYRIRDLLRELVMSPGFREAGAEL